jgi:hypothetical protein
MHRCKMSMLGLLIENVPERSKWWLIEKKYFLCFFLWRICAVKIDRKGQNNKELTVRRGELIEIENSSKKWWRARNFHGDVGHVPHNIVEEIEIEQRPVVCRTIWFSFLKYWERKKNFFVLIFYSRKLHRRIRQV